MRNTNPPSTQSGRTSVLIFLAPVFISLAVILVVTLGVLASEPDPVRRAKVENSGLLWAQAAPSEATGPASAGTRRPPRGLPAQRPRRRGFSPVLRGGEGAEAEPLEAKDGSASGAQPMGVEQGLGPDSLEGDPSSVDMESRRRLAFERARRPSRLPLRQASRIARRQEQREAEAAAAAQGEGAPDEGPGAGGAAN